MFTVNAASYPTVFTFTRYASVGENVPILFNYYPAFNNEKIEIEIYDSNGKSVGNADFSFNNSYASSIQYFTVNWDTTGCKAGVYTIEARKYFYSYYNWNETPNRSNFTITLIDDLKFGDPKRNAFNGSDEKIIKKSYDYVEAKSNTICTAYSAWDKISIRNCTIRLSEMYLGSTANSIVKEENMFNVKANSSTNWIFMKFELYNGTNSEISADDFVSMFDLYKSTGNRITALETATMGGDKTGHQSEYDVQVQPKETREFCFAILMPKSQGMPYLKIDDTFLNTNPSASKNANHYTEKKEEIFATCTKAGKTVLKCSVCGYTETVNEVPALGHNYKFVKVAATATKNGSTKRICQTCGDVIDKTTIYKASRITASETEFIYNGKIQRPTIVVSDTKGNTLVNNVDYKILYSNSKSKVAGKYTATIQFMGNYSGKKVISYTISPKKVSGVKITSDKAKTATISFTSVTGATGYEIYYGTSKTGTFKRLKTTTDTIYTKTKLNSSTAYYFKIRAYVDVNGEKIYGDFSSVKGVKTK